MKTAKMKLSATALALIVCLNGFSALCADAKSEKKTEQGLKKAQNTVNNVRQADPPKVSTTTKPSPVGQPVSDYKPKGPSLKIKEPPSPGK